MESNLRIPEPGVYGKGRLDLIELCCEVSRSLCTGETGAISTFLGIVKSRGRDGKDVSCLEIEAYEEYADKALKAICNDLKQKYSLDFVGIWHLAGSFRIGEPLVLVLVSGKSRREVFPALQEAVRRYKTEPPLFKKEVYVDGSHAWMGHEDESLERG